MSSKTFPDIHVQSQPTTWKYRTGWALTLPPALALLLSALLKLTHAAVFVDQWVNKFGFPESALVGLLELSCAVRYLIPRTAIYGGILVAAFFGGATVAHVRIGDPGFITPVMPGVLAWGGLYLRDERLRALLGGRTL